MRSNIPMVSLACAVMLFASESTAAALTTPTTIVRVRTGWDSDQFAIVPAEPLINPAGCSAPDGYATVDTRPGYKTHYAAALTAMSTGRRVSVVVSDTDCVQGRPRLMGIYIEP